MKILLYHGCIDVAGHYVTRPNGATVSRWSASGIPGVNEAAIHADGAYPPPESLGTGIYNECIVPPLRIVSWWDRSVDHRPGSHSTFIGYGYSTAEEIIDDAYLKFPKVMNRQPRPVPQNKTI